MATASTTSLLLAPPRFPCRPNPTPTILLGRRLPVPALTTRPRSRFAAARREASLSLVPAWQLRAPPRRRNVLREKASPPSQVRPPNHDALDPHNHQPPNEDRTSARGGTGEPQSASLDGHPSPDLDGKPEDSDRLDAACPSGNADAVAESNLGDEKDLDFGAKEGRFCGITGTGPVFSVYQDPDGGAVRVEVNEDEIVSRCRPTAGGEGGADSRSVLLSRARAMAMEFECGEREVPRNSSLVRFVATEKKKKKKPHVVDAEVSVVRTNGASLRAVSWGGFATVCGICVVLVASKLIWRNVKTLLLSRRVFGVPVPGMKAGRFDKGNIKVISNVHMFPGDLLGRPQLERSELMNNLKKAKESRERFSFRKLFSSNTVVNEDDASITGIRRMVADVNTLEEGSLGQRNVGKTSSVVFSHSVVSIEEEISATYVRQSVYHDDVSELDSIELHDIDLSNNIIDESMEQCAVLKDAAPIMDIIVKNQYNVGEIEQPEPRYNDESIAEAKDKDRTYVAHATEKASHVYSPDDHSAGSNGINTPSAEFGRKGQFTAIAVSIQGLQPSALFSCDNQMIYENDNARQINNDVVPETADDFSPNGVNIASSGLKYNGACLSSSENDIHCMQEIEAPMTFANKAQTANCEYFVRHVSVISKEACKNLVASDISTMESPQRNREGPEELMTDNMQLMRETEPSNNGDKQMIYANAKNHKIDIVHNETKTSSEPCPSGTLNKASTSQLYALQEETGQLNGVKVSIEEKQEKILCSNKEDRAYLQKDEGKLQKEMSSDKEPEIKLSAEGVPGTSPVVGPSNGEQETKRAANKQLKKVQSNQGVAERVTEKDIVQNGSMVDQEKSSENVKRRRRKNQTNAFRTQGSQTKEEITDRSLVPSLPDDAPKAENMKPLGEAGSSTGTLSSKLAISGCGSNVPDPDIFSESQQFIVGTMRKEELKLDFQKSKRVEAAATETKTNMHGYNVMHERSTDINKSKTKMGVAAAKKSTKRKSLSKRTKSSNPVSNKDSEEPTGD